MCGYSLVVEISLFYVSETKLQKAEIPLYIFVECDIIISSTTIIRFIVNLKVQRL